MQVSVGVAVGVDVDVVFKPLINMLVRKQWIGHSFYSLYSGYTKQKKKKQKKTTTCKWNCLLTILLLSLHFSMQYC